ncbi:family 10 glycosylhydrolase [Aegicerativicinus sediminis]|uniref:family 10 glycosylhydrolase n=1 Tax=Aegicerativicinus sediminis TaxID=2893202 RepID=UPI001E51B5FB|nr:family 10 glycosylhydrolase [Aegicerativicinus sediminis]
MNKLKSLSILLAYMVIFGCQENNTKTEETKNDSTSIDKKDAFRFSTWTGASNEFNSEEWANRLEGYKEVGISEALINGSPEILEQIIPIAKEKGIKIHGWMWTLNRPGDTIANKHPEWYSVNKNGENSLEKRAYVDYYQWLSPFHPEAREHIKNNVRKLMAVDGLASIHLDYVRYVDVILGADLQPKYDIVQTTEMPEYDYGYHPIAREGYKAIFGVDPINYEHPELSSEWRQYRLNAVTSLVNEIAEMVHSEKKKLTAAVFPFPEMSRQMVRQAWNDWNLDTAFPMLYHNFYRENINWIGFAAEQGVKTVDYPIMAGIYMPALSDPEDLEKAIRISKEKGASGVSLFTANDLSDTQKNILKKLTKEFNNE